MDILIYLTHAAIMGNKIIGGKIILDINEPNNIRVQCFEAGGISAAGYKFDPNTIRIKGLRLNLSLI